MLKTRLFLTFSLFYIFTFIFLLPAKGFSDEAPYSAGLLELSESEKALLLENFVTWESSASTRSAPPAQVINISHLPKVGNQGSLGICGSFCVYYYLYTYYYAKERGITRPDPAGEESSRHVFSPAWGVLTAPHGDKTDQGVIIPWGASPAAAIETIVKQGVVSWEVLPYDPRSDFYKTLPSADLMKAALRNKALQGITLNGLHTVHGLQNLKQFLAAGNIAVSSWVAPLNANFDTYPSQGEDNIRYKGNNSGVIAWPNTDPNAEPRLSEGHALTIIGYDDNKEYYNKEGELCHGALLVVNSWGSSNWGVTVPGAAADEKGFAWLAYDLLLKYGKLGNQAFSMRVRSEDYRPGLAGTLTIQNQDANNWDISIGAYPVFWPSLLNLKTNGQKLNVAIPDNKYIINGNVEKKNNIRQYVFDLSGLEKRDFASLEFSCPILTETEGFTLGSITGFATVSYDENGEEKQERLHDDINLEIKRYSPQASNPIFNGEIAVLQKKDSPLSDLFPQKGSFCWGDANGDDFPDLAASAIQKTAANDNELEVIHRVYINNGNGTFAQEFINIPVPGEQLSELRWADMNNDGKLDLVAANFNGVYIFVNDGKANFTLWKSLAPPIENNGTYSQSFGPGSMVVADFDLDGRPDIAISGNGVAVGTQILFQLEAGEFTAFKISERFSNISGFGVSAAAMEVGDIDGDGYPDLVAASASGDSPSNLELIWYRNNGDCSFTPKKLPLPAMDNFSIAIADFDNDGCDDILYSGGKLVYGVYEPDIRINGVLKGKSEGYPERIAWDGNLSPLWGGKVLWADLNNDGKLEAIICGLETNAMPDLGTYSYGDLSDDPRLTYKNLCRVHCWNEKNRRFEDSGLSLPGAVGFSGPSMLSAVDLDNDGDLDLLAAGVFTVKAQFFSLGGPGGDICGIQYFENKANDFLGIERVNQAPPAPTGLTATALGSGKAQFSWIAGTDDKTPAHGLRYFLRIGTSSGSGDVLSGKVPFLACGQSYKPGVVFRRLPDGTLHWSVRAMDSNGLLSDWSVESAVTVSGSEALPSPPLSPIDEETPPPAKITVSTLDSSSGYVSGGSGDAVIGSELFIKATPRSGWRFSHWEGEVYSPLARKTKMLVTGDANPIARFVPDDRLLYSSAVHSALRSRDGNIWAWSAAIDETAKQDRRLGNYKHIAEDTLPALAAKSGVRWLGLNNQRTFYGISNGEYDSNADNHKNFMRDSLMAVLDLNGFSWWKNADFGYDELSLDFWAYGDSYLASYVSPGPNSGEKNWLVFSGAIYNIWKKGAWLVSNQSLNEINLGIVQAAMTDNFVLFLSDQGTIYAVGNNASGQFGDGSRESHLEQDPKLITIEGLTKFKAIAVGEDVTNNAAFALAIDFQGRVWSWGNNDYGQLGLGDEYGTDVLTPQQLPEQTFHSPVVAIACGYRHALAKTEDGQLYAWGDNNHGQAGQPEVDGEGKLVKIVSSPTHVEGLDNVFSIAAAAEHSLALLVHKEETQETSEIFVWGDNSSGQLTGEASGDIWTPANLENPPKVSGNGSFKFSLRSLADAPGSDTVYPGFGEIFPAPGTYSSRIGSRLQIEAVDGERYVFSHWEGKEIEIEDAESRTTTVLLGENSEVCAIFEMMEIEEPQLIVEEPLAIEGTVQPAPGIHYFNGGAELTFRALPKPGFKLSHWETAADLQNGDRQQNQFAWTLQTDMQIAAKFAAQPFFTKEIPNIEGGTYSLTKEGKILWWTGHNRSETFDFAGVPLVTVVGGYLGLGSDGRLYAWGTNRNGERGNGNFITTNSELQKYNLVLGPDGEAYFTDAVAVFALDGRRFAQRADNKIYIWGRIPLSEEAESRPRQIKALPEKKLLEIAECSGTVFFLFADGELYSWGTAEHSGTGKLHENPKLVLSDIKSLAANSGQILVLKNNGTVYTWGTEVYGFGGTSAKVYSTPEQITFSSTITITKVFAVGNTCYAINNAGQLYTWGANTRWGLGVGEHDTNLKYYSPRLHPNTELPEFLSIRGGSSGQVIAEAVDGTLWKWGWNCVLYTYYDKSGQVENRPAIAEDITFPEPMNQTVFKHHKVTLDTDSRCEHLLSFPKGVHTFLEGEKFVIYADSSDEYVFEGWEKDGEPLSQEGSFLKLAVNESFSLFAQYEIADPLLDLRDCEAEAGGIALVPLILSNTGISYEAFDLTISFPAALSFRGLASADTQLNGADCTIKYWPLGSTDDLTRMRMTVRQKNAFFAANSSPLANLRFELPYSQTSKYTVSIDAAEPILSRAAGRYADKAEPGSSATISTVAVMEESFSAGWIFYAPSGSFQYENFADWCDDLYLQGILISPFAWYWDTDNSRWEKSDAPITNQPMLLYVENGGSGYRDFTEAEYSANLKKGWNLLSVPEEKLRPSSALAIFSIGSSCYQIYSEKKLQPGLMYWVFCENDEEYP